MFFIYKITNPAGSIYIGQTSNIDDRIKRYKHKRCKGRVKLYHSILKYGWSAHSFEIIEECSKDNYGTREIYWIAFYKSNYAKHKDINGLNLCDGGDGNKGYKHTEESKKANSDRAKARGTRHMNTKEAREKARNSLLVSMKGKFKGKDNPNYGKRWTQEKKDKAKAMAPDRIKKLWQNPEYREKVTKAIRDRNQTNGTKLICNETGNTFQTISEAAKYLGIDRRTLSQKLNGRRKNTTTLRYLSS